MLAKSPPRFKYLKAYDVNDADLFKGRDQEIAHLYEMVFESNVILVYGMAKTGKTSLVDCGLASRFSPSNWLLVHVQLHNDINIDLRNALIAKLQELPDNTPQDVDEYSLGKLLYCLFLTYLKPIYLVFDQFENIYLNSRPEDRATFITDLEQVIHRQKNKTWRDLFINRVGKLFETATEPNLDSKKTAKQAIELFKSKLKAIRRSVPQTRIASVDAFLIELEQFCNLINPQEAIQAIKKRLQVEEHQQETDDERVFLANLNCKVILIMREEYVALLNDFEEKVPELAYKKLRLEPLVDNVLIEEVIPSLCSASNMRLEEDSNWIMENEPVATAIVRQVKNSNGFVNLAYLNYYLKTLWESAQEVNNNWREVTLSLVKKTGSVQELLEKWLNDQKSEIAQELQSKYTGVTSDTVSEILSFFVTPEGSAKPKKQKDILIENFSSQLVVDCLHQLAAANIIHRTSGLADQFELTDASLAHHIQKSWNEWQLLYFSVRNMIQEAYDSHKEDRAAQRTILARFIPKTSLILPDTSLALIQPHEQRLKSELQAEVWTFWLENKLRIKARISRERMRLWAIILLLIISAILLAYQLDSAQKQKRQLAQREGNRLLQLLDNSEDQSSKDSAIYNAPTTLVYNNPSLKYRIALAADSILPQENKLRAQEWLSRLEPTDGTPFYNLSIDSHGPIQAAGFLDDGRVFAQESNSTQPPQVWQLSTSSAPWQTHQDTISKRYLFQIRNGIKED